MTQKIGVLGSGDVAKTLAAGFKKHGYDVIIGSRTPEKLASWAAEAGIATGTFAETADRGEIVVLAVAGKVAEEALKLATAKAIANKIVIDVTNPIADAPPDHGVLRFFTGVNDSLMERLQAAYPEARFVKAFNTVGNAFMVDPHFPSGKPTMFYCGNDAAAKAETAVIIRKFGWEAEDMGFCESARPLESLCQLWCVPGMLRNEWTHAFAMFKLAPVPSGR